MYKYSEFSRIDEEEKQKLIGGVWKRMKYGGSIYVDHDGNILAGGNKLLKDKITKMKKLVNKDNHEKVEIDDIILEKTKAINQLLNDNNENELRREYPTISENVFKVANDRKTLLSNVEATDLPEWAKKNEIARIERDYSKKIVWLAKADSYNDIKLELEKGVSNIEVVLEKELGKIARGKIMETINSMSNSLNPPTIEDPAANWYMNQITAKVLAQVKQILKDNPLSEIDDNIFIK